MDHIETARGMNARELVAQANYMAGLLEHGTADTNAAAAYMLELAIRLESVTLAIKAGN